MDEASIKLEMEGDWLELTRDEVQVFGEVLALDATEVHDTPEEAVYLDGSLQVGGAFLYELWPGLFVFRGEPEEQGELKSVLRGH